MPLSFKDIKHLADEYNKLKSVSAVTHEAAPIAEVASKFSEPRGVMRHAPAASEIVIPQQYGPKPVTVTGSNPDEALTAYNALYGSGDVSKVAPDPEALSKRLLENKQAQNMANPEEATQVLTRSDLHKIAGLSGAVGAGALASQPSEAEEINPLTKMGHGVDWYNKNIQDPVSEASQNVAKYIIGNTTPATGAQKQELINTNAPIMGAAINPSNYIPYVPESEMGMEAFQKLRSRFNK